MCDREAPQRSGEALRANRKKEMPLADISFFLFQRLLPVVRDLPLLKRSVFHDRRFLVLDIKQEGWSKG